VKLEGLSIIGFNRAAPAGPLNAVHTAASGELLEPGFYSSTEADVDAAATLAAKAFAEYSRWPAARRAKLLLAIAQGLESNAPAIIERAMQETALPQPRLQGEMGRTCGQLRLFATLIEAGWWTDARIDHADPQRKPAPKPDVRSMLVALGPVAVFGASNFPLAFSVAGGDTAAALAAGCPVIVKAHEGHPGTSELTALVIQHSAREAGAPDGLFSLLFGFREVGAALVKHPAIAAVGFTGSLRAGRALMDLGAARPHPIPVYAEMGSVNPVFILGGALAQRAEEIATGLHGSVTLGVGQFCTNPGLVFLEGKSDSFLNKLVALIGATAPGTMLTGNICKGYGAGLEKLARSPGVRRLASVESGDRQAGAALFVTDAATFLKNPALAEEVFGPVTLVVECATRADLLAAAHSLEGQLTATLQAAPDEFSASSDLIAILETKAGRLLCNGFPTGVEVCHAMNHGGPYPATSDGRSTSVGTRAITRFARPICLQDFPDNVLPDELKEANPLHIPRLVDGKLEPGSPGT
jgi:alpha-ketoglutaric semialdehyde dehydrogenase